MEFTYSAYIDLINLLKEKKYIFSNYNDYSEKNKSVIFRHDVDICLERAVKLAKIENNNNIKSTYFILLSTEIYNVFSKESDKMLKEILELGHEIGLHFDELKYDINNKKELENYVQYEKNILEKALGIKIKTVSMHIPSNWILENDIQFKNIKNSYSKKFLKEFKYLSDSMMNWREDVVGIIEKETYDKLHILTHPFWYTEKKSNIKELASVFIENGNLKRYDYMRNIIINIEEIITEGEVK